MQQKEKFLKKVFSSIAGFFSFLCSLHNGVEKSVENVENPCGDWFYVGGNLVMGNITQEHFLEKRRMEMGNVGKGNGNVYPQQKNGRRLLGDVRLYGAIYRTITRVPMPMRMQPMMDLVVTASCRNTKARIRVMTTLSLSMGTTLDASPICSAL